MKESEVTSHFDSRATRYRADSAKFPWSYLRTVEARRFFNSIGSVKGKKVLELGSGAGYYSELLIERGASRLYAVDLSQPMLANLRSSRIDKIHADAATVILQEKFPVIVSAGLFEFVSDPIQILRNARRHSTECARLIILFPRKSWAGNLYKVHHFRKNNLSITLFDPNEFSQLALSAGWLLESWHNCALFSCVMRFRVSAD